MDDLASDLHCNTGDWYHNEIVATIVLGLSI